MSHCPRSWFERGLWLAITGLAATYVVGFFVLAGARLIERWDLPGLRVHYRRTGELDVPALPPDVAALIGGPRLFALVHGGKLGAIFQ